MCVCATRDHEPATAAFAAHEITRTQKASVSPLFDYRLRVCAGIDEQPEPAAGQPKVVQQLRPVFLGQRLHGLDLDYDLP